MHKKEKKMNASSRAKQKYNAKTYDRIQIMIPKGMGEVWKAEAKERGLSLNALIQKAVAEYLQKEEKSAK